jgi:hypothetical protein
MYVFKKLHVTPLVGSNRNGLHILLNRTVYNLLRGAVVTQVDYLNSSGLNNTAHDVNRSIVAIKERSRRDDADVVLGLVLSSS